MITKYIDAGQAFDLQHLCRYFSERAPNAMLAVEGHTSIVRHVNEAFLTLAGMRRDALVGYPFAQAVPEGVANLCGSLLSRVYETGIPETLAEQAHGADTGRYWTYTVWAILGPDELPVGVMIQVSDATEVALFRRHSAELNEKLLISAVELQVSVETAQELAAESEALAVRLQAAIAEKEYFIAVLSHELRTPLSPVLIAMTMLQQDQRLDAETRDLMQMVHRNVAMEARLIDDLLDMTRMNRGKLKLDRDHINLIEVLEHSIAVCKVDIEAAGLFLDFDPGSGVQFVNGDPARLQQVFSNLLRNAIKFTPAGGRIGVRFKCGDDHCHVEVTDSGIGMSADFLPKAFAAFEQDQTDRGKAGLGLGLTICKTIVDLHGGRIIARSEGKNRGSTFEVTLPTLVAVDSVLPVRGPESSKDVRPAKSLRILLVEDHADTARIMRKLLTHEGHVVEWAASVTAGIKLAELRNFDLLLSDLALPDGSGVDLMRSLRQKGSKVPGIVLSGYGQDHDIAASLEAGFAAHLVKPLSVESLRQAIKAFR